MDWFTNVFTELSKYISTNLVDWVFTGVVTFCATRIATREFYEKNRVAIARDILCQALRDLIGVEHGKQLPDDAKVIFVEYKGRCLKLTKKEREKVKCKFFEPIRRTIVKEGADVSNISSCRPVNYGVLGVANILQRPVVYDFSTGKLRKYEYGQFEELEVKLHNNFYYHESIEISSKDSKRGAMIAVPIVDSEKLYGGITFDISANSKVFKEITDDANTVPVLAATKIAERLVKIYFNKKGEDRS